MISRSNYYAVLDGKKVQTVNTENNLAALKEWGEFFEKTENRKVDNTEIGDAKVSTVFLGLNHSFGSGPDLWFETMVFGGDNDGYCDRYTTWDEAAAGHAKIVGLLKAGEALP